MSKRLDLTPPSSLTIARRDGLLEPYQPRPLRQFARSSAAGNTLEDAQNVPAYRGDRTYRDRVTPKAPDFYKLNLLVDSDVLSVLQNRSASPLIATALDANGNPAMLANGTIARFKVQPKTSESVNLFDVPAGRYYLQLSTRGNKAPYRLNIAIERSCGCS